MPFQVAVEKPVARPHHSPFYQWVTGGIQPIKSSFTQLLKQRMLLPLNHSFCQIVHECITPCICLLVPMPRHNIMSADQLGRSTPPQPAPRTDVQTEYIPPVIYPSLVRRPDSSMHEQQVGGSYQEVPASEPDLNRRPARSAMKGGKTNEQSTPSVSSPTFVMSPLSAASPSKVSSPTVRTTPIASFPAARLSNAQQQAHLQQLEQRLAERRSAMESPRPSSASGTPVAFAAPGDSSSGRGAGSAGVRFGGVVVEEPPARTSTPPVQSAVVPA